jgi:hypothetical protein
MSFGGTTPPVIRHLLLCQNVEYDFGNASAPYSLRGIITVLGPESNESYPLLFDMVWVFVQGSSDPGEYEIWVDPVPVDEEGDATGVETTFGPWVWIFHENVYVESRAWRFQNLPFLGPGLYEFRLRCGPDVLARTDLVLGED